MYLSLVVDVWKDEPDRVVLRTSAFVGGRLALEHGLALSFDALIGASRFRVTDSAGLFSSAELAIYADLRRKSFDPQIEGAPSEAGGIGVYPGIVFGGTWRSAKVH